MKEEYSVHHIHKEEGCGFEFCTYCNEFDVVDGAGDRVGSPFLVEQYARELCINLNLAFVRGLRAGVVLGAKEVAA